MRWIQSCRDFRDVRWVLQYLTTVPSFYRRNPFHVFLFFFLFCWGYQENIMPKIDVLFTYHFHISQDCFRILAGLLNCRRWFSKHQHVLTNFWTVFYLGVFTTIVWSNLLQTTCFCHLGYISIRLLGQIRTYIFKLCQTILGYYIFKKLWQKLYMTAQMDSSQNCQLHIPEYFSGKKK